MISGLERDDLKLHHIAFVIPAKAGIHHLTVHDEKTGVGFPPSRE
jgi:hypothetical protein